MDYLLLLSRALMCLGTFCLVIVLTKLTLLLIRLVKDDLLRSIEAEDYFYDNNN